MHHEAMALLLSLGLCVAYSKAVINADAWTDA
jgi:hypothetical protein